MKRTFIAIPLSPSENLLSLLDEFRRLLPDPGIKWVEPENLHLTLKFLGDTSGQQIPFICRKLDSSIKSFRKTRGLLKGLDFFSIHGNPSVLFSKIEGIPDLEALAKWVDREMEQIGFLPEKRSFNTHLTLARIRQLINKKNLYALTEKYKSIEIQAFETEKIVLYESILRPAGPIYIPLHTSCFPL